MKAIMVMFDSLNRKMLSAYGCKWTKTPNFMRLAERTVRFDNHYTGSLPCMPARRELHTGRYNFLHRSWGPMEPFDDSMPEILKNNGIYTHLVTDHSHYWEDGGATYHTRYSSCELIRGQEGDRWKVLPELFRKEHSYSNKDAAYFPITGQIHQHDAVNRQFMSEEWRMPIARTFSAGLEFLENNSEEDNWFLQIESFDPHEPFTSAEPYKLLYPHSYEGSAKDWPPYHIVTENEQTVTHYKMEYAALLSMCDAYLGKLLNVMDEKEMWKDTMLIVCTDHGYLLGEHGWWSKTVMPVYEEICHLPFFVHDPRCPAGGQSRSGLTQTIDIPATLLDYFGIPLPKDMQGRSVCPLIQNLDAKIRNYALFGFYGSHVNLTDGRFTYMKAPMECSDVVYEYTLMPTHMRSRFSTAELKKAQLNEPFSFTKGCPVLKIPAGKNSNSKEFGKLILGSGDLTVRNTIDNNSLVYAANFGDKLFALDKDPNQETPLQDFEIEAQLANVMISMMAENDCPPEGFARLGLHEQPDMTPEDIELLHQHYINSRKVDLIPGYTWEPAAANAYRALMNFIPDEIKNECITDFSDYLLSICEEKMVKSKDILSMIQTIFDGEKREMLLYFVEMSARTS